MAKDESVRGREIRTTWEDSGKSTKSSSSRKKSSSRRSLDDYLMKKNKRSGAHNRQIEECDISLCTATTSAKPLSQPTCVMKRNPQAIIVNRMPSLNRFSSLAKVGSLPNLMLIEVKDATSKPVTEVATSHFGGVGLGIANHIYGSRLTPELKIKPSPTTEETRNENEGCDQQSDETDRTVQLMTASADEVLTEEDAISIRLKSTLFETPPLPQQYWTEPSSSSFNVRGANYLKDRKKIPSADNLFRLFAVDLVKVSDPILTGMCNHPDERVQRSLRAEKSDRDVSPMPPFIFCVNITLPGSPAHHLVMYYAVDDLSLIAPRSTGASSADNNNKVPFNKLASRFFFGDSDEFRDSTFKLIPRIVKGNFLVKNAVGNKPTILGKKLKQHYIQDDRFFELIVDVASDKIAKRVVGLSVGYAKSLVVDMGFVLEGKHKTTLPENMMGTVRLNNIDFKADLRSVKQP